MVSSSDDDESSDDQDEKITNVRSLLIKSSETRKELSSDYVFKRKLGDLIFDANFEAGNLGFVEQIDKFTYDLMIRPDVANPRYRLWFYFSVSNHKPEQCVIFSIVNLSENLDLLNEGLTPVVRCKMYPNWVRLRPDQVFYHRSAEHQNRRVLSIAFKFNSNSVDNNEHQFALAYPYTVSRLTDFYNRWQVSLKRIRSSRLSKRDISLKRPSSVASAHPTSTMKFTDQSEGEDFNFRSRSSLGFARSKLDALELKSKPLQAHTHSSPSLNVEILCRSVLSKPVYRITIQDASISRNEIKLNFVLLAGWASGNLESASMYVCQGFVDFMLSDDIIAASLRQHANIFVYPMPDPDAIWVGNSRSDLFGQVSRTRELISSNARLYHSSSVILESIEQVCSRASSPCIVLELKTNWASMGTHMIGYHYNDTLRMERHLLFPRLMSRFTDGFYLEQSLFVDKSSTVTKSDQILEFQNRGNVDQYKLEVSAYAHYRRTLGLGEHAIYCQEKYLLIGKSISYALLELVRTTSSILLPTRALARLDEFHPGSDDIDDLILKIRKL